MVRFVKYFLQRIKIHAMILALRVSWESAALLPLCNALSPTGKPIRGYP
jgi:hypothetical protein